MGWASKQWKKITKFVGKLVGVDNDDEKVAKIAADASVKSTQIAAEVASENIDLQMENIALQREGLDIAREGVAVAREETEFQRSQYNDWKDVYGDLQENLGEYYNTLGPERIISMGLQAEQVEFQKARNAITKSLHQRGISGSGVEGAALTSLEGQHYTNRASVRATAEQKVQEQKLNFLGVGLGQGAQLLGTLAQTTGQQQNAYSNITQSYGGQTNAYNVASSAYSQRVGAYNQQGTNLMNISQSYLSSSTKKLMQTRDIVFGGL